MKVGVRFGTAKPTALGMGQGLNAVGEGPLYGRRDARRYMCTAHGDGGHKCRYSERFWRAPVQK
jgi:hypothetical protein